MQRGSVFSPRQADMSRQKLERKRGSVSVEEEEVVVVMRGKTELYVDIFAAQH